MNYYLQQLLYFPAHYEAFGFKIATKHTYYVFTNQRYRDYWNQALEMELAWDFIDGIYCTNLYTVNTIIDIFEAPEADDFEAHDQAKYGELA
jgi:hypothetical protein